MSNIAQHDIKIAFDNGGGAILVSRTYAHSYNTGKHLAQDVRALLDGGDTDQWDGNDEELLESLTEAELDRYERVYRMAEIVKLTSGDDENTCVGVDDDEKNVEIHWGSGTRPQSGTGYTEYEFWSALLA